MRDLDETDRTILTLLLEDARRPYSDIAEHVGLSPPAVSDRVTRLEDLGVIRGFTVDVDRSTLDERLPVLLELRPHPAEVETVVDAVAALPEADHRFRLGDGRVLVSAVVPDTDVHGWLRDRLPMGALAAVDIALVASHDWDVGLPQGELALECVVCGNAVGDGGEVETFGGEPKAFCCPSCLERYTDKYEHHSERAN